MKILFLGYGKMGSIIAQNIKNNNQNFQISAIDPHLDGSGNDIKIVSSPSKLSNYRADIIFLAIKPQNSSKALNDFITDELFHENTIFISIIAGKKIEFFNSIIGRKRKIIRSMPNLPISVNNGIFCYLCNDNITKSEKNFLYQNIFNNFGYSFEITNEDLFHSITAICGSGPAYIFLLQEILYKISSDLGIDSGDSARLVKKLLLGSSLLSEQSKQNFEQLKDSVTSKNGTTQAALDILEQDQRLSEIFTSAIKKASDRSKQISADNN